MLLMFYWFNKGIKEKGQTGQELNRMERYRSWWFSSLCSSLSGCFSSFNETTEQEITGLWPHLTAVKWSSGVEHSLKSRPPPKRPLDGGGFCFHAAPPTDAGTPPSAFAPEIQLSGEEPSPLLPSPGASGSQIFWCSERLPASGASVPFGRRFSWNPSI